MAGIQSGRTCSKVEGNGRKVGREDPQVRGVRHGAQTPVYGTGRGNLRGVPEFSSRSETQVERPLEYSL